MTDRTDEQKDALAWLERIAAAAAPWGPSAASHARALKLMLAEPRLPAEPSEEMLKVMQVSGVWHPAYVRQWMREIYDALYAHLTACPVDPSPKVLPPHVTIHQTGTSPNSVIETCVEAMVRAGLMTVDGSIGDRINRRIAADAKPKKTKPVFHCEGSHNPRHISASLPITADWHDVNQAIAALCNDGYEIVMVRREMVPE